MSTRVGGFIGVSTSATDNNASGIWDYDSQAYFKRQGESFWPAGESFGPISATGGTVTTPGNGYKYHFFTGSGPFHVVSGSGAIDVYLVAGGGGGSFPSIGAAGGAGGMRTVPAIAVSVNNYTVQCGAGGAGGTNQGAPIGYTGTPSKITDPQGNIICQSTGGGRGMVGADDTSSVPSIYEQNGATNGSGGSGGGGDYGPSAQHAAGAPGNAGGYAPPEGNNGGAGYGSGPRYGGGGGGGAGGVGGGPVAGGGTGGSGSYFNDPVINGLPQYGTPGPNGAYRYFAGGGGGGAYGHPGAGDGASDNAPDSGGGGRGMPHPGQNPISPAPLKNGQVNTGGGGGGHGYHPYAGPLPAPESYAGNGGSGFLCIRYTV